MTTPCLLTMACIGYNVCSTDSLAIPKLKDCCRGALECPVVAVPSRPAPSQFQSCCLVAADAYLALPCRNRLQCNELL